MKCGWNEAFPQARFSAITKSICCTGLFFEDLLVRTLFKRFDAIASQHVSYQEKCRNAVHVEMMEKAVERKVESLGSLKSLSLVFFELTIATLARQRNSVHRQEKIAVNRFPGHWRLR